LPPPTSDFEKGQGDRGQGTARQTAAFKKKNDNYMTCTKRLTRPKLDNGLMEKAHVFEAVKDER